jgi:AcrR family transcriptional regulator
MGVSPRFEHLDRKKKNRIYSVALSEFATKGYRGASINSIVDKLSISKGSIFNYFTNKEGLFQFVFYQSIEKVKDNLRDLLDGTSDQDFYSRIEQALLRGVSFIKAHPRIFRIYLCVHYESGLKMRTDLIKSLRRYSIKFFTNLLETARERGEIPENTDVPKAAFVLDSVLERFLQAYGIKYLDADLGIFSANDERVREWARGVVNLLKNGIEGCTKQ